MSKDILDNRNLNEGESSVPLLSDPDITPDQLWVLLREHTYHMALGVFIMFGGFSIPNFNLLFDVLEIIVALIGGLYALSRLFLRNGVANELERRGLLEPCESLNEVKSKKVRFISEEDEK